METFKIQTLSERHGLRKNINWKKYYLPHGYELKKRKRVLADRLGDPVTVITAGVSLLSQIFPNIFGGSRKRLTQSDWLELIPGNGYWTTKLRNHLAGVIHYNTDVNKINAQCGYITNLQCFTQHFVSQNKVAMGLGQYSGDLLMQKFYQLLETERLTGGTQPGGQVPQFISGAGMSIPLEWLLIGGLGLAFVLSRGRRK